MKSCFGPMPRAFPAELPEPFDELSSCNRRQPSAHPAATRCKPSMLGMSSSPSSSFNVAQSISTDCRSSSASSEELPKPQAPSIPTTVATSPSGSLMERTLAFEAAATAQRSISLSRTAPRPLDVSAGACGLAAPVVDVTPCSFWHCFRSQNYKGCRWAWLDPSRSSPGGVGFPAVNGWGVSMIDSGSPSDRHQARGGTGPGIMLLFNPRRGDDGTPPRDFRVL